MSDPARDEHHLPQQPAPLSTSARMAIALKHVVSKVLKYGVLAGVIGGGLFAFAPATFLGPLALGLNVVSSTAAATVMTPVATAALAGAKWCGLAGVLIGGVVGVSGMNEAVDAAEERRIARYEQRIARQERMEVLASYRDRQRAALANHEPISGLTPPPDLPHWRRARTMATA